MTHFFNVSRLDNGIHVVAFDTPEEPVNTLSEASVLELRRILREIVAEGSQGIVFTSTKKDFVVGANIKEINRFQSALQGAEGSAALQGVFNEIENLSIPTAAAIRGQCLGGGLELALACTYLVVADDVDTKLGFPEVQLGLLPGAGGTQRTPRKIGIINSLDLILTGRNLSGAKASKMGLVDIAVPPSRVMEECQNLILKRSSLPSRRKTKVSEQIRSLLLERNPFGRQFLRKTATQKAAKQAGSFYPAPYKIIEAIFDGFPQPLQKGLDLEAKLFGELSQSNACKCLIHVFDALTRSKKSNKRWSGDGGSTQENNLIGIIGAGFMGSGIATVAADRGYRVRLSDPNLASLGKALKNASGFWSGKVKRRSLKPFEAASRLAHISPGTSLEGFGQCSVIIEAVFEDLSLKHRLINEAEKLEGSPIFASNTSAIPIREIAAAAAHPERVVGMHFFSPVEKMPLVEVIRTPASADAAVAAVVRLGERLGKKVIVVNDGPGFYTTRALAFYLFEALKLVLEGNPIQEIDGAMTDFGFPVGPIALIDEVGIDVGMHVIDTMAKAFPDRIQEIPAMAAFKEGQRLGRKNNAGFYRYADGKKQGPDEAIYKLLGVHPNTIPSSRQEIQTRCVMVFVNESLRCLEEGILQSPEDGDIGAIFGLGFPPFLGGPFYYVHTRSPGVVQDELTRLAEKYGPAFSPTQILARFCAQQSVFSHDEGP